MNGNKQRIVAIGDIHGYSDLLQALLSRVEHEWQWDKLVFLGDYIDRGPDSKRVIDIILDLRERYPGRIVCLRGNHEQWMMQARSQPRSTSWLLGMEGITTIRSYDSELADQFRLAVIRIGPDLLLTREGDWSLPYGDFFERAMPASHLHFFSTLADYHDEPGVIFAHAGIKPGVAMPDQVPEDLCWITQEFYHHYNGMEWVIVGHMATDKLRDDGQPLPFISDRRIIGIDTSVYRTGVLTAYLWPDGATLATPRWSDKDAR